MVLATLVRQWAAIRKQPNLVHPNDLVTCDSAECDIPTATLVLTEAIFMVLALRQLDQWHPTDALAALL